MHGSITVVCVDVEDAKKLVGHRCLMDDDEVELVRVTRSAAVVKHSDGSLQKVLWHRILGPRPPTQ